MLHFENVCTNHKNFSLKNISFTAEAGFITAITGSNGAGKTTLINLLTKENSRYTGTISFNGIDIHTNHDAFRKIMGIVSDEKYFFDNFSINENASLLSHFYSDCWDSDLFKEQLKLMELSGHKKLSTLSRGEYIRFQLAFAMAHNAKLYIMDEATAGMDPIFRRDFFKTLHGLLAMKPDITILMTTHIEEDIKKHMDYIGILESGKLISFSEVE